MSATERREAEELSFLKKRTKKPLSIQDQAFPRHPNK
jgi:hypothetical protein